MKNNLIETSSVSSRYQTVIPQKIRSAARLHVHQKLTWHVIVNDSGPMLLAIPRPRKWSSHLSGLGKNVWRGVNTTAYLKNLRSEWHKQKNLNRS